MYESLVPYISHCLSLSVHLCTQAVEKNAYSIMLYTHNATAFFAVIKRTVAGLQMAFQEHTQFVGQKEKN
jgi:hypothetical protein